MRKKISLQWQLTFLTALLVTVVCIVLHIFVSSSAMFYMGSIGDSIIAIFPEDENQGDMNITEDFSVDVPANLAEEIKSTQNEFFGKSIFITCFIVLTSSVLTYFIVGFSLKPLKQFENQVEEIEAKNMKRRISIKTSVRELVPLESSFNKMLKRLDESFSMQKQFSANVAHELRTPLAIMRANIEVFHKQQNPEIEDYEETIDMIELQTERLSGVIDTLLQMTETQTAAKADYISLSDISEEVICDLTKLANEYQVQLNQLPGDAHIMGNDTLICRAIFNLVENAIKYNKKDGMVTIEIKEENGFAKVIITDTGLGIVPSEQNKIFDPFYRVDKSRSRAIGGAGLGLSLVREIAKRHDGDVRVVQSTVQGTKIELTLKSN